MTPEEQKEQELLDSLSPNVLDEYLCDLATTGVAIVETVNGKQRLIDPFSEEGMDILEQRNNKP